MSDANWVDVGSVDDLRSRPVSAVSAGRTAIAITWSGAEFGAVSGVCNHAGGPLGEGLLEDGYIVCPWHGWKFHGRTGLGEPGFEEDRVPAYAVKVEGTRATL